jgi:hypothetical protein
MTRPPPAHRMAPTRKPARLRHQRPCRHLGSPIELATVRRARKSRQNRFRCFATLDEALAGHALHRAFLYRARLDAVRPQASVDGRLIDRWQLAACRSSSGWKSSMRAATIAAPGTSKLLATATGVYDWLAAGGARPPIRAGPLLGTPRRPPAARAADRRGGAARRSLA